MGNVDFSLVFPMKMRSWRVCLGSFWAHVEVMCAHLGDLRRSSSTWTEILEDLGQQEAGKRQARGGQRAKGGAQVKISGVKRGTKGRRGPTRADEGLGRRRWGGQPGEGGTLR